MSIIDYLSFAFDGFYAFLTYVKSIRYIGLLRSTYYVFIIIDLSFL